MCIGGSSGALDALQRLLRGLPTDFPAAVFIVRHLSPDDRGWLIDILRPLCALPVDLAADGEPIGPGRVVIAPADRHLVLDRKTIRVIEGPKENWVRPAIDPLFRSAAQYHGPRTIGVLLSGKLDDGAAGLWALKRRGGFVVVQSPNDALAPEMPTNALAAVDANAIADAEEIGKLLPQWLRASAATMTHDSVEKELAIENAYLTNPGIGNGPLDKIGHSAGMVCPECGGQLWQIDGGPRRYRCHVGHAYSAQTLLQQQREVVEETGWRFLRAIEEERTLIEQINAGGAAGEMREKLQARERKIREVLADIREVIRAPDLRLPVANGDASESP